MRERGRESERVSKEVVKGRRGSAGAKERARTLPDSFMSTNVAATARSRAQSSESAEVCRRGAYSRTLATNQRGGRRQREPITARRGDASAKYSRYISRPVTTANYPQLRAGDRRRRTCERDGVTDELTSATNRESAWCAETALLRCCCHRGCHCSRPGPIERSSRRLEVRESGWTRARRERARARAALLRQKRSTCSAPGDKQVLSLGCIPKPPRRGFYWASVDHLGQHNVRTGYKTFLSRL